jgi:hypothetical protein
VDLRQLSQSIAGNVVNKSATTADHSAPGRATADRAAAATQK